MAEQPRILWRVAEVAKMLGVSRSTIYAWIARGQIPVTRLGGVIRIPDEALRDLIAQKTKLTE
jgi:excisionase family DNA binding protein